jgi:cell surface hyaluronidase
MLSRTCLLSLRGHGASRTTTAGGIIVVLAALVCGCVDADGIDADSAGDDDYSGQIGDLAVDPPKSNPPAPTLTANPPLPVTALPNGGAEATTGWSFTAGGALALNGSPYVAANPPAPQGTSVLRLQTSGTATLAVSLPAGGSFRLRYKAAQRKLAGVDNKQAIRVAFASTSIDVFQPSSSSYVERVTRTFTASAGASIIKFTGLNPGGGDNTALIDDLRIERVRDWHIASSWSPARVPMASDNVSIPAGHSMSLTGPCVAATVNVSGELLATTSDAKLDTRWVLVRGRGARFEVGRQGSPFLQSFTLTLTGNLGDSENILDAGTKFLMVEMEGQLHLHGNDDPSRRSWTKLGATASAGTTTLTLSENVTWKAGDQIVIAASKDWTEAEKRTLARDAVGNLVTLTAALTHAHHGAAPKVYSRPSGAGPARTWTLDQRAEVGLLTRNIKIVGDAGSESTGLGGHMMVMWCADCGSAGKGYIDGVELTRMGQKQRLRRYPMHWHMLGADGAGQYFTNSSVHHTYNRAVTIHGTWSTRVENNVMYDHIGHGLFLEDGSEINNVIRKNLVLSTLRPPEGQQVTPSDNQFLQVQNSSPSSYWITNPHNTFVGNVAAGTIGTGFWFIFPVKPIGPSATDPRFSAMTPYRQTLIEFRGNTAHSGSNGFDVNDQLSSIHGIEPNRAWDITTPAVISDFTAYSNRFAALYAGIGNATANVIYDNAVLADNRDHVFFATYHVVRNSLLVANSGNGLFAATHSAYRTYDGAGQMENSHLVGYNNSTTTVIATVGAATKHTNHRMRNLTFSGTPRIEFPNAINNAVQSDPRQWGSVILDETGSLASGAGRSIVSNHTMLRTPGDIAPPGWINAFHTAAQFCYFQLSYGLTGASIPNVTIRRKHAGQSDVVFVNTFKVDPFHQMPVIVNGGYTYEVDYAGALPSSRKITVRQADASVGDDFLVTIKAVGNRPGFTSSLGASKASLAALTSSTTTGYYREAGSGNVSIKFVAAAKSSNVTLTWN